MKDINYIIKEVLKHKNAEDSIVDISFVSIDEIKELNSKYRNINSPTDVLSFSLKEGDFAEFSKNILGDVIICKEYVENNCKENGIDFNEELIRVAVHGILHLLGYNHYNREEEKEMFEIQEKYVKKFLEEGVKI
jgi:probable rRNA maturation factor